MADIFREVDEELKQERYTELWRRYGRYGIAVVVLCVAAMAAWKGWEAWQVSKRHAEGLSYGNAMQLLQEGKTAEATEFLGSLGQQTSSGYGILARFQQAAISARSGDAETALQLYDALSSDRNVPRSMRDLATILGGLQALGLSSIPSQALEERIAPLAEAGSHYRHMALEILALSAHGAGDTETAVSHYQKIVDDAAAPPGIRNRALQMMNIIRGG